MTQAKRKKPTDVNRMAAAIVEEATDEDFDPDKGKDPAAVALGKKGAAKGGRARAEKLSPKERREIAQRAAAARWGSKI